MPRPISSSSDFWDRLFPANKGMAVAIILGVWFAHSLSVFIWTLFAKDTGIMLLLAERGLVFLISILASYLLYRLLCLANASTVFRGLIFSIIPAMPLALLLAIVQDFAFYFIQGHGAGQRVFDVVRTGFPFDWPQILEQALLRFYILAGSAALYLALAHARAMQTIMQHNKELQRVNHQSQLEALRYQLNPHFVFNALNSVSSLIIDRDNARAETLVDDLADFMRGVLTTDGHAMVTVKEELGQQTRYLEIEQVRFPNRLSFEVNIAPETQNLKIPILIIQPLIENAIKFGVAKTAKPVKILIKSSLENGQLMLSVSNSGRFITIGDNPGHGEGIGLNNIRERLQAIYGPGGMLILGNSSDDMAVATILIPYGDVPKNHMLAAPWKA